VIKSAGIHVLAASIRMAFRLYDASRSVEEKTMELESAFEELQKTSEELEETNDQLTESTHELMIKEERFRNTLDSMIESCQIIGFDWTYLYVNDCAAQFAKRNKNELLGKTMMECYPGIESQPLFKVLSECMTTRQSHRAEFEFVYPDQTKGNFESCIHPVSEGLFVLSMDISDRKKIEATLHESEHRFRMLVENSPDGIFIQTNGLFAYSNAMMQRMIDPEHGESLAGKEVVSVFAPEYRDIVRERIRLLNIERRNVPRIEEVLIDTHGKRILTEIMAIPIEYNGVPGALVYVHDVSVRKKTESELQQLIQLKDTLMAELQHRVKNSLTIINSLISLESAKLTDESTKQVFMNAQSRIHVMAGIYEMLYSSQDTSLNSVRLDLYIQKLTSTIVDMCNVGNRISLSFTLSEIYFDLKRTVIVCLILNELVTNTIKHSCMDETDCTVSILLKQNDNTLELVISDKGTSMPAGKKSGTGLSLVNLLTKEIHAEMHTSTDKGYSTSLIFPYELA
jgi:PAS domain S-box-containing protein